MRVIPGESRLLSTPRQQSAKGCKRCCPLVMRERERQPGEGKKKTEKEKLFNWIKFFSPLCLCLSLSLQRSLSLSLSHPLSLSLSNSLPVPCCSIILRDGSEGDHLLIHLFPALLPVPPPLPYRRRGLAFALPTALCCCQQALVVRRVSCHGWGSRVGSQ